MTDAMRESEGSPLPPGDWLVEPVGDAILFGTRAGTLLASGLSPYQAWEVWDTPAFGRLYRLDGRIMATERDECMCHEALVHVAGLAQAGPTRALVLGGGDGGSARELLRYPTMRQIVVAELDETVVEFSRRYLSCIHAGAFDDPRVRIVIGDAQDYVLGIATASGESFDLIIFDLTDPDMSAAAMYRVDFFATCARLLSAEGALCLHLGSPLGQPRQVSELLAALRTVFPQVTPYFPAVPSYGGLWAMACASLVLRPADADAAVIGRRIAALAGPGLRSIDASSCACLLKPPACLDQWGGQSAREPSANSLL